MTGWTVCNYCNAGKVTCTACWGMRGAGGTAGICYTCNGTGKVNCQKCRGKGSYQLK